MRQAPQLSFVRPAGFTDLLLLRHGETVPAREDAPFQLVGGHGDPELDPRGIEQSERLAERLARRRGDWAISAVYVTNLRRTAQTAAPLVERLGVEPMVEADLREVFLGEWEGGLYRLKVIDRDPLALRLLEEQRWDVIPGAEDDDEFAARIRRAIERIASRHPDQTVAVFTHGGVIARALAEATGSRPFAFLGADNASINHLVVGAGRWILRSFNDVAHLEGLEAG